MPRIRTAASARTTIDQTARIGVRIRSNAAIMRARASVALARGDRRGTGMPAVVVGFSGSGNAGPTCTISSVDAGAVVSTAREGKAALQPTRETGPAATTIIATARMAYRARCESRTPARNVSATTEAASSPSQTACRSMIQSPCPAGPSISDEASVGMARLLSRHPRPDATGRRRAAIGSGPVRWPSAATGPEDERRAGWRSRRRRA